MLPAIKFLSPVFLFFLFSCNSGMRALYLPANTPYIEHYGTTVYDQNKALVLIGSASYAELSFTGDSCIVYLKNIANPDDYNYVAIEIDNIYQGRLKIEGNNPKRFAIRPATTLPVHVLRIYKATESHNGQVALSGVKAKRLHYVDHPSRKKIEFIGNSITAGMANDTKEIPCGTGKWYDQHNAYWAYGPRIARALEVDFLLSAVSGIGIYRNWNSDGPVMPDVYESAYLEIDSVQRRDFGQYLPDIVSICLGTNDFSDGDGKQARLPFDSAIYIKKYIDFIGTVYKYYPSCRIVLLTSPMLNGNKAAIMLTCLETVKGRAKDVYSNKPAIEIFKFETMVPKGCSYHPDIADHEVMARQLIPFFRRLLGN
jgi:lysophospholipase L1-like esterase